jgi:hypothetical protein
LDSSPKKEQEMTQAPVQEAPVETPVKTETPAMQQPPVDPKESKPTEQAPQEEETLLGETEKQPDDKKTVVVPEKYEFKAPEGMTIDEKALGEFTPVFKEIGLSQENAQKLVNAYAPYMKQMAEQASKEAVESYKTTVEGWKQETQKELGADAQQKMALAAKAINKLGTPALKEFLNETGFGNHKELVSFFVKVGSMLKEDSVVDGKSGTSSPSTDEDRAKKLYPTMKT